MRRLQPFALALCFPVVGFFLGGVSGVLIGLIAWGIVDQVWRRRVGTWSPRRYPWQRVSR